MPEGPSIVILKEQVQAFKKKKVLAVGGNSKENIQRLKGETIIDFKSFGKQFLICFKTFTVRIHLMMFGSYRINEQKETPPRLSIIFSKGELNFYACSVKMIEVPLDQVYDWTADVMSDNWDAKAAFRKLNAIPGTFVCDALLDQNIFAGVGNIIKNEVLFRVRINPLSEVGAISAKMKKLLIKETHIYCFQFLEWKKKFELKKHWLAHTKKICPRDHVAFSYGHLGKTNRRSFYCNLCQVLYTME
jgi:endonuclease-8